MKTYSFAKIKTRPFPTMADLDNRLIFGDVQAVINVSNKEDDKIIKEINKRGIAYYHFPINEETEDIGWGNIKLAVIYTLKRLLLGESVIVYCDCGNHRSPLVVEAVYFCMFNEHFDDEYKGSKNHLFHDLENGFLPVNIEKAESCFKESFHVARALVAAMDSPYCSIIDVGPEFLEGEKWFNKKSYVEAAEHYKACIFSYSCSDDIEKIHPNYPYSVRENGEEEKKYPSPNYCLMMSEQRLKKIKYRIQKQCK